MLSLEVEAGSGVCMASSSSVDEDIKLRIEVGGMIMERSRELVSQYYSNDRRCLTWIRLLPGSKVTGAVTSKDNSALSTTLFQGLLLLSREVGNIFSTPVSTALSKFDPNSMVNHTLSHL